MLNRVMLIGRLGADPEIRHTASGDPIATLNLATTRRWKDRNTNERREETEWHRVTFFGALAKVAGDYLKKGSQVHVEGRIKTDKYQKDGQDVYRTGIIGEALNMLDSKPRDGGSGYSGGSEPTPPDYDDDIPF